MAEIEKSIYFQGKIIPSAIQISQTQGPICVTPPLKSFSVNILSPLFDFGPIFKCYAQRMQKKFRFSDAEFYAQSFEKKNHSKISNAAKARQTLNIPNVAII